jgi:hypothetical protein
MTRRTVRSGLMTYVGPDGVQRFGVAGDEVDVHPDHLKRFDEVNGGAPEQQDAEPKQPAKKATTAKKRPETMAAWRAWVSSPLSHARYDSGTTPARPPLSPGGCGGGAPQRVGSAPTPPAFIGSAGRVRRPWW